MTDALSRRRLLAGTAAAAFTAPVAALPALAAVVTALDPVLALRPAWQAARDAYEDHFARMAAAHDRFEATRPPVPEVLFARPDDHFGPCVSASGSGYFDPARDRPWYTERDAEKLREGLAVAHPPVAWRGVKRERAEEIVAASERYNAARDAALEASGYEEDTPEEDAVTSRMAEITGEVADTPALTLAGLIFKAEAAALYSDPAGDTLLERAEKGFADGYELSAHGIGLGIVRDLLRLAGVDQFGWPLRATAP